MSSTAQAPARTKCLQMFFVVTMDSIYQVRHLGDRAVAKKIVCKKMTPNSIPVGETLPNGTHVAIGEQITAYRPKIDERRFELLTKKHLGGQTSVIVGLFFSKQRAEACFRWEDKTFYDARWMCETNKVLSAIGEDHPTVYIYRIPGITAPSHSY